MHPEFRYINFREVHFQRLSKLNIWRKPCDLGKYVGITLACPGTVL
jgi:hypothetical protein